MAEFEVSRNRNGGFDVVSSDGIVVAADFWDHASAWMFAQSYDGDPLSKSETRADPWADIGYRARA